MLPAYEQCGMLHRIEGVTYKNIDYVTKEVESLAAQLKAVAEAS